MSIQKLKYPAITICNQGWIDQVLLTAMLSQYRHFALGIGHENATKLKFGDDVGTEKKWKETLYPGAKDHPWNMVKSLASHNPGKQAAAKALVNKGYEKKCQKNPKCDPGWHSEPVAKTGSPGGTPTQYVLKVCLKNFGYSNFTDDKCTKNGANRYHASSFEDAAEGRTTDIFLGASE